MAQERKPNPIIDIAEISPNLRYPNILQKEMGPYGHELGPDIGMGKTNERYRPWIDDGFEWQTNTGQDTLVGYIEDYEAKGFEVRVGDDAFARDGTPLSKSKVIFTRRKTAP